MAVAAEFLHAPCCGRGHPDLPPSAFHDVAHEAAFGPVTVSVRSSEWRKVFIEINFNK